VLAVKNETNSSDNKEFMYRLYQRTRNIEKFVIIILTILSVIYIIWNFVTIIYSFTILE